MIETWEYVNFRDFPVVLTLRGEHTKFRYLKIPARDARRFQALPYEELAVYRDPIAGAETKIFAGEVRMLAANKEGGG